MGRGAGSAALAYFAIVFVAGFALGTFRVLVVEPSLGPVGSVALEVPVMLGFSWLVAGWLIRRMGVGPTLGDRLGMGLAAAALLVAAEITLGAYGFSMPVAEQIAAYATPRGVLTLAGQLGFALMPLVVARSAD